MKKPLNFSTYKLLHKMSFNEFNRWLIEFYMSAYDDGAEECANKIQRGEIVLDNVESETLSLEPEDCVSALSVEDLKSLLLSVNGIGEKRADTIMERILQKGVDETLWE